jgi:hypothetical protein
MVIVAKVRNLSFKHKSGTVTLLIAALQKKKTKNVSGRGQETPLQNNTRQKRNSLIHALK